MQIGLIGLGKMGFNLALNLKRNNFHVVAYDINASAVKQMQSKGVDCVVSAPELAKRLSPKRIIWLMVPAGKAVDDTIAVIKSLLNPGDIVIDGGNSHYKDSIQRAEILAKSKIDFLDCGTSGGLSGALNGVCAMVGGKKEVYDECEPVFKAIAVENGYLFCGESGSGHFVKMVHNGIEYGMMQSIAEGFELMRHSGFNFDNASIAGLWNNGSVIRGWLMELAQKAFSNDSNLETIKGVMYSSGEAKWMVETALEKNISTPVIAMSLMMRYRSQQQDSFAGKVVAALRHEFGGHAVNKSQSAAGL